MDITLDQINDSIECISELPACKDLRLIFMTRPDGQRIQTG